MVTTGGAQRPEVLLGCGVGRDRVRRPSAVLCRGREPCAACGPVALLPRCQILANYSSLVALAYVMGMSPLLWLVWLSLRLWISYENHSGYGLAWGNLGAGVGTHVVECGCAHARVCV
jgi:hypothetical protein